MWSVADIVIPVIKAITRIDASPKKTIMNSIMRMPGTPVATLDPKGVRKNECYYRLDRYPEGITRKPAEQKNVGRLLTCVTSIFCRKP